MNERERNLNSPWRRAARWNDSIAEEHGLEEACRILGLDLEEVMHVAKQRALRARLMQIGRWEEMDARSATGDPTPIVHTEEDANAIAFYAAMYLDALVLGWRARGEQSKDDEVVDGDVDG